jgi:hypothetical protein
MHTVAMALHAVSAALELDGIGDATQAGERQIDMEIPWLRTERVRETASPSGMRHRFDRAGWS